MYQEAKLTESAAGLRTVVSAVLHLQVVEKVAVTSPISKLRLFVKLVTLTNSVNNCLRHQWPRNFNGHYKKRLCDTHSISYRHNASLAVLNAKVNMLRRKMRKEGLSNVIKCT